MKFSEMLEIAVRKGIENDPRGKEEIEKQLKKLKEKFEKMSEEEKEYFDLESLENPYTDTRILLGDRDLEVNRILTGIDLEVGEVLLAESLTKSGKKIDALVSHHPEGGGLVNLHQVMYLQADVWHKFGVPINVGDSLIGKRAQEVYRRFLPINHERTLDAAKLLGFAFMSIHTAADNCVTTFLQNKIDEEKPDTVKDVIDLLLTVPEYKHSKKLGAGPVVIVGSENRRAGKVMVDMTGGTEGPKEAVEKLGQAGVGTIVCMHMVDEIREIAEKNHVNVIIAGHIASDSIGLNLILDEYEKRGVDIIPTSGLIRVSRV
ncbi:MAG: NGG1p interacting factor NIF3 [Actinobacteria bacterium]|nr:NGG1p interacting factor NIF3 [Actinomycetota bacterium]